MKTSAFVDFVLSQLAEMGEVRARAMFGGWGIYLRDVMFALIVDDRLYLKADSQTQKEFEAAGCEPFRYSRKDSSEQIVMSYWEPPLAVLESAPQLRQWAATAYEIAVKAKSKAVKKKGRRGEGEKGR